VTGKPRRWSSPGTRWGGGCRRPGFTRAFAGLSLGARGGFWDPGQGFSWDLAAVTTITSTMVTRVTKPIAAARVIARLAAGRRCEPDSTAPWRLDKTYTESAADSVRISSAAGNTVLYRHPGVLRQIVRP